MDLRPGASATLPSSVTDDDTAAAVGSGDVAVLGTPVVLARLEAASVAAVAAHLDPGSTTVGTRVELDHLAPTPVGATIEAQATLEHVDGRRLRFAVSLRCDGSEVAAGTVERVVVDRRRFLDAAGRPA